MKAYGKFILAGEHSVLRGGEALVFPVKSRYLQAQLKLSERPFEVHFTGASSDEVKLVFWSVVERALNKVSRVRADLKGELSFICEIPFGTGLGASAALCVAISKWFSKLGWVEEPFIFEFSKKLEDLFHGESSGADIAAALEGRPITFFKSGDRQPLELLWSPQFYLSYCGCKGITSECVEAVKGFVKKNPQEAQFVDDQMKKSTQLAKKSLATQKKEGLPLLIKSMKLSKDCFDQWGLTKGAIGDSMNELLSHGALAVKPTGSGGGGFILSLWDQEPPQSILSKMFKP